jgi:hypothetical protein
MKNISVPAKLIEALGSTVLSSNAYRIEVGGRNEKL